MKSYTDERSKFFVISDDETVGFSFVDIACFAAREWGSFGFWRIKSIKETK